MKDYFKTYLKNRPLFLGLIRSREIPLYQPYWPFKKPVLDFGCGDGFFAKVAFEKIDVGLDIDPKKLAEAKKENVYQKLVLGNETKIPFPNNYFSTIVSNCVFEHIPNLDYTLLELHRVLKSGGKLYCTVMADNWEKYIFLKKFMHRKQKHYHLLSAKNSQKAFEKAGFKIEKTIGYLDKPTSRQIELLHFFSIDSLINYHLTGRWNPLIPWYKFLPQKSISTTNSSLSGALFYILKK